MRLDPHLPKLYPRAHADVGACHERRYAYGCDWSYLALGRGSFWRLKTLKVDASDKAGFSSCIAAKADAQYAVACALSERATVTFRWRDSADHNRQKLMTV